MAALRSSSGSIRSIARGIAVLQAVNRSGSLSLAGIAADVGIPHPTATRIVRTLVAQGLIEREPDRKMYRPTALVQTLSCGFQNHDRLVHEAREPIVALTRKVGWPISVVTRAGRFMVVRDSTVALTSLTFNVYQPGITLPIFASASGQVFFAYSAPAVQKAMLAQAGDDDRLGVQAFRSAKRAAEVRDAGYAAVASATVHPEARNNASIAVPILSGGELVGALTLVFFSSAMTMQEAVKSFLPDLRRTAQLIGTRLEKDEPVATPGRSTR